MCTADARSNSGQNPPGIGARFATVPRPAARVLTLLELLQSGGTRTVSELADRLGVDGRTVRRYVEQLIDLDVPVESVRGRYGGYRLGPGYRVPPLMFGDEEALAVLLGLVAGRRAGLTTAQRTANETAAAKIRRVLPRHLARRLDTLLESLSFTEGPGSPTARTRECCSPWRTRCTTTGRSRSATPTARDAAATAPCTRTGSWRTRGGGTSPAGTWNATRTARSASTASRTPARCPARSRRRRAARTRRNVW